MIPDTTQIIRKTGEKIMSKFVKICERKDFLCVYKPAGLPVQTGNPMAEDLEHLLRGEGYDHLPLINGRAQPVEGLVLFALNRKSAAALSRQLTEGRIEKTYLAAVEGVPEEKEGRVTDFLLTDRKTNLARVVPEHTPEAKKAVLDYRLLETKEGKSLLRINLLTGRHHQIRAQLANLRLPILEDMKYNTDFKGKGFPALCSHALSFTEPSTGKRVTFSVLPRHEAFRAFDFFSGEQPQI